VRKALRIPCHTIAANAGVDAQEVVTRVMQEQPDVGYDALHGEYVDMMKAGIIDPTKVCLGLSLGFVLLYFRLFTFSDLYWFRIFLYCFVCQYQSSDWLWRPPPK